MKSAYLKMKHAYLILGIDPGPVTSGFVFGYFYAGRRCAMSPSIAAECAINDRAVELIRAEKILQRAREMFRTFHRCNSPDTLTNTCLN